MRSRDWAVLALGVGACAVLTLMRLLYILYTADVIYVSELRPLYGFVRGWL